MERKEDGGLQRDGGEKEVQLEGGERLTKSGMKECWLAGAEWQGKEGARDGKRYTKSRGTKGARRVESYAPPTFLPLVFGAIK